jgi:hypothetical protein
MIRFKCPYCQRKLKSPDGKAGAKATCPACKQDFSVPPPVADPGSVWRPEPTAQSAALPVPVSENDQKPIPELLPIDDIPELEPVDDLPEALPVSDQSVSVEPPSFVTFSENGDPRVHVSNLAEAKLAIRQLRAWKKELALKKRAILQQQREIRAAYAQYVRQRGSKVIGGRTIGRFIRAFQTIGRDGMRRRLADELAPLEKRRASIDAGLLLFDRAAIELQRYMNE